MDGALRRSVLWTAGRREVWAPDALRHRAPTARHPSPAPTCATARHTSCRWRPGKGDGPRGGAGAVDATGQGGMTRSARAQPLRGALFHQYATVGAARAKRVSVTPGDGCERAMEPCCRPPAPQPADGSLCGGGHPGEQSVHQCRRVGTSPAATGPSVDCPRVGARVVTAKAFERNRSPPCPFYSSTARLGRAVAQSGRPTSTASAIRTPSSAAPTRPSAQCSSHSRTPSRPPCPYAARAPRYSTPALTP
ncbi:hypothetical protein BH24ACT8_BH24ACT8_19140 [soil metagenome]